MRVLGAASFSVCLGSLLGSSAAATAADPVVIVAPQDGDTVPSAFSVTIKYGDVETCDTDGCEDHPAERVTLYVDDTPVENCQGCASGEVTFDIALAPGQHELVAEANYHESGHTFSKPVQITVEEGVTTAGSPDTESTGGSLGTTSTGDSESHAGCACDHTGDTAPKLLAFGIFLCSYRRRDRR